MLWAVVAFAAVWSIGITVLNSIYPDARGIYSAGFEDYGVVSMHILMAAYFAHLLARTVYLSINYKKTVII